MDRNHQVNANDPGEEAVVVTGHDYQNDNQAAGWQSGGVMQSDSMLGPQDNNRDLRNQPPPSLNENSQIPTDSGQYGDDRNSTVGDKSDSGGRHDNPYDSAHPVNSGSGGENRDPATLAGLSGYSDQSQAGETDEALPSANRKSDAQSHLYTAGTTEEDYPAT